MLQKSAKSAAELESMITAKLREHPECESAGVVGIRPMGLNWDAAWSATGQQSMPSAIRDSQRVPTGFAESSIWLNRIRA